MKLAAEKHFGIQLFIGLLLLLTLVPSSTHAWPVATNHPVNPFLKTMDLKGLLRVQGINTLPLQSNTVIRALRELQSKSSQLNPYQQAELSRFLREFNVTEDTSIYPLRYKEGSGIDIHFSGFYDLDAMSSDSSGHIKHTRWDIIGGQIEGNWGPEFSYQAQAGVIRDFSSDPRFQDTYDPALGLPYNTPENRLGEGTLFKNASQDAYRSMFSWTPGVFTVEFGQDWNEWGPGVKQHAGISQSGYLWLQDSLNNDLGIGPNNAATDPALYTPYWKSARRGYFAVGQSAPMPQLRLRMDWGKISYTQFMAQRQGLIHSPKAMLFGHRLESHLGSWRLGIYELLSTAREDESWAYWTPLVPYFVAEHHTGDRDNTTLGLDVDYQIQNGLRTYTELFLDDLLSPTEIYKNYWGNKFAWTLGLEWVDFTPWGSQLQLEYARVEPWLFSHVTADNQFQHHGSLIGSSLPPNSHQVFSSFSQNILSFARFKLEYTWSQHQLYDRGSSIFDLHIDSTDPVTKVFLGKSPKTTHLVNSSLFYMPWYYSDFEIGYQWSSVKNIGPKANQFAEINAIWLKTSVRY